MTRTSYAPLSEFRRVVSLELSPHDRTNLFASLCRINTLYMIKKAGSGHIGTSFSCLDVVSWLFLNELPDTAHQGTEAVDDTYFSSKGHDAPALYSVLTGLEKLDFGLVHLLRRVDGLPGHPDVSIAGMVTNTGSLGMGVSKAKGMALSQRLQGTGGRIFVLTGDGELQEGQFWESLQSAANRGLTEVTVIVDHNKVQSDTFVSDVSDLGDLEAKFQSFGWACYRVDGHDTQALASAIEQSRADSTRPSAIIADTIKGKGVSFMEHTAIAHGAMYEFHSGAPTDAQYAEALAELLAEANRQLDAAGEQGLVLDTTEVEQATATGTEQRLVNAYAESLLAEGRKNPRVVALDADLAKDCGLLPFKEQFPERFVECGIAEQDMVSQAGGLALKGFVPVVHSFACFLSTRPNEQIYNNATEHTKIVYMGALAGLLPGGPGHSHQSVRDISLLGSVPGLTLLEPGSEEEVRLAVDYCFNRNDQSSYLRLASVPVDVPYALPDGYRLEEGRGTAITAGDDAVIFAYGPVMLTEAYQAAQLLSERGIGLKVFDLPWLNRVDSEWLEDCIKGYSWVFTLDDHYLAGGQGDLILSRMAEIGLRMPPAAMKFGVDRVPVSGTNDEVLHAHGLDAQALAFQMAARVAGARG
jgi:transketolase